jgi:hypothetical protein
MESMAGIGQWRKSVEHWCERAKGHRMTRDEALRFMDESRAKSRTCAPGEDSVALIRRGRGPL